MMTYGFKARFSHELESDTKLTTIRAPRKDKKLPKPGEVIRRYTGMRTKQCRHLGDRVCKSVKRIQIKARKGMIVAYVEGRVVSNLQELAKKDGFLYWAQMADFFSTVHALPFKGYLIEWEPLKQNL